MALNWRCKWKGVQPDCADNCASVGLRSAMSMARHRAITVVVAGDGAFPSG